MITVPGQSAPVSRIFVTDANETVYLANVGNQFRGIRVRASGPPETFSRLSSASTDALKKTEVDTWIAQFKISDLAAPSLYATATLASSDVAGTQQLRSNDQAGTQAQVHRRSNCNDQVLCWSS